MKRADALKMLRFLLTKSHPELQLRLKYSSPLNIAFLPLYFIKERRFPYKTQIFVLHQLSDGFHSDQVFNWFIAFIIGMNGHLIQSARCESTSQLSAPDVWSSGSSVHLGWKSLLVKAYCRIQSCNTCTCWCVSYFPVFVPWCLRFNSSEP